MNSGKNAVSDAELDRKILPRVSKPARYLGSEFNSVHKDWDKVQFKTVLAFPDVYEVGMSHLGLKILYEIINSYDYCLAERVYAPWTDMEQYLRQYQIPLFSLESRRPLQDFDLIGFTLQYEMSFTNILNMLDLAGIPLKASDRARGEYPLIVAGGPCAYNAEPLADFIDCFILGEGEEVNMEQIDVCLAAREKGADKYQLLQMLSQVPGLYVPSLYKVSYLAGGGIAEIKPVSQEVPAVVTKRIVRDFDKTQAVQKQIVPFMDIVHNRIMLEIMRGCTHGCRFCQAGMIYRPVRERTPETLQQQAHQLVRCTGYDEISLSSLSSSDYSCIGDVVDRLLDEFAAEEVGISLPSLRIDSFSVGLAQKVQQVRRSSLTFAPEAGTQRLRDVINKGVNEENLKQAVMSAFGNGWHTIKLYFMIGLPTETFEDLDGIADLAYKVLRWGEQAGAPRKKIKVTVSASSFVPKADTPFQWLGQDTVEQLEEKQHYLVTKLRDRRITFNWHTPQTSFLEAVFARGDRRLGSALQRAWELGAKFDSWTEHFNFSAWMTAFDETGIDARWYANRQIPRQETLPWEHLDCGVSKKYLLSEFDKAFSTELTRDCRHADCTGCGACGTFKIKPQIAKHYVGHMEE